MQTSGVHIARNDQELTACVADVEAVLDPTARLPAWPFLHPRGEVRVMQYTRLLGSDVVPLLQALVASHDDESVAVVAFEPVASYYLENFAHRPAVRIDRAALTDDGLWEGIAYEPGGDPTGALAYTADVTAMVGSSRTWSIWGQRDWDLALVHSPTTATGWTDVAMPPFADAHEALEDWVSPEHSAPLPDAVRSAFLRNLATRGTLG